MGHEAGRHQDGGNGSARCVRSPGGRAIDGFVMGEPFPPRRRWAGFGRILFQAARLLARLHVCILVVRQDLIDKRPETVQVLVDGIARSGLWLDKGKPYRETRPTSWDVTTTTRNPALLRWALTKPMDRVVYTQACSAQGRFRYGPRPDD